MTDLSDELFSGYIAAALDDIPEELASKMSNVQVVMQDEPGEEVPESLRGAGSLLGLYQGVPLTGRGAGYSGTLPDRITLYKLNIMRAAGSSSMVQAVVKRTLIHEVAHHFGIDDERLSELGWG